MIARYSRKEMASLWSPEARLRHWRDVELAALEAMVQEGIAPPSALDECRSRAGDFSAADVAEIDEIERSTKHDVIAFLTFLERRIGPSARWLHLGMTSSDVLDTALAMTLRDSAELILTGLDGTMAAVRERAIEHKYTVMIGRSHGIHAEPITFGLKLAVWYDELRRSRDRIARAKEGIAVGKISGAVGTFAHLPPQVEERTCALLGLRPALAATQVIQRDVHAELFSMLAVLGSTIEQFAVEIRHLQRTEVREVEEPFTAGQKGSSAMPHKRNPILAENLTGLARLLRGYAVAALEDVALWHERDISHSSVERVIGPDATILSDFMLHRFSNLIRNLRVYPERMAHNLELLGGVVNSQRVLLELTRKGMDRQAAYAIVQRNAMKTYEEGIDFKSALLADAELRRQMSADEISALFSAEYHLRHVDHIFERAFGADRGALAPR
ncbi:MAG TPA: adenylosuccinate lyase [Myxococcaceae bacterium]|nr:adenylosuccinate lyase [Myxococcaceae bacterium]